MKHISAVCMLTMLYDKISISISVLTKTQIYVNEELPAVKFRPLIYKNSFC
jgi:hypothetical protein